MGARGRGERIAKMLEGDVHMYESSRSFIVWTGLAPGTQVRVSVVVSLMGAPNMDFVVRELRSVLTGDMVIMRLGSCGAVHANAAVGSVIVADSAITCRVDYDSFHAAHAISDDHYTVSGVVYPDPDFTEHVFKRLEASSLSNVRKGLNCSCDSFYSSQGRNDPNFRDENDKLITKLRTMHPELHTLEMETFQLFHLGRIAASHGRIRTAGIAVVFANRSSNSFMDEDELTSIMSSACTEALQIVASFPL